MKGHHLVEISDPCPGKQCGTLPPRSAPVLGDRPCLGVAEVVEVGVDVS